MRTEAEASPLESEDTRYIEIQMEENGLNDKRFAHLLAMSLKVCGGSNQVPGSLILPVSSAKKKWIHLSV